MFINKYSLIIKVILFNIFLDLWIVYRFSIDRESGNELIKPFFIFSRFLNFLEKKKQENVLINSLQIKIKLSIHPESIIYLKNTSKKYRSHL